MTSSPTTISDLKKEINNLKEDIIRLKEKNVVIEVRLDAIQALQNLDNASESSSSLEGENDSLDFIKNLDSKEKDHIAEKDHIPKEIPTKEEVKNLLLERRKMTSSPTTISDLKEEINNLKEDIIRLKEKNVVIEVR
ncbi:hypothetical protein H5410_062538 [Solanum commersonii]|uniref:Uncharacterized protein n=1 Tax=Solanum commersonii TaxID=4109 RepID=A0A9J5WBU5_SOLCO|nr:hypothetical protein H5410_062538 [Solanum commersonii]